MRLNQFISSSGLCSRRQANKLIKTGRVTVNGKQVGPLYIKGQEDVVKVDNQLIEARANNVYIMLNKPPGITCTAASHIDGNIIDFINYPVRVFPVGRLDKQSTGLILLTNDGSIVNTLLKAESGTEKDYEVTVNKPLTDSFITELAKGVYIYNPRVKGPSKTNACKIVQLSDNQFLITITQGLNRQIRRMCRRYQYTVTQLKRVRIKHLVLGELEEGQWRYLTHEEIAELN